MRKESKSWPTVPPDWPLTVILAVVAVCLLVLMLIRAAEQYP
jgi:hypothetical protein